jgi:hypothetical protein
MVFISVINAHLPGYPAQVLAERSAISGALMGIKVEQIVAKIKGRLADAKNDTRFSSCDKFACAERFKRFKKSTFLLNRLNI